MNTKYFLAGTPVIPDDMKPTITKKILTLLDKGGIRNSQRIKVGDNDYTVAALARPDKNGIISFNYSIFEKEERGVSTFDTNTFELTFRNCAEDEFGLIIIAIQVLLEVYSSVPCFLCNDKRPMYIGKFVALLEFLLDEKIETRNGTNAWDMYEFFHKSEVYEDIDFFEAYEKCFNLGSKQMYLAFSLCKDTVTLTDDVAKMSFSDVLKGEHFDKIEYLYRLFIKHSSDPGFEQWLSGILSFDAENMEKAIQPDEDYCHMAEISSHLYTQEIIKTYSISINADFWTVWDRMGCIEKQEIVDEDVDTIYKMRNRKISLHDVLIRDYDDEMFGWCDCEDLKLSVKLKKALTKWKNSFNRMQVTPDVESEDILEDIMYIISVVWRCRYIDKAFVDDFMRNKNDPNHKKWLLILKNFIIKGIEDFPELTEFQAIIWTLIMSRDSYDKVLIAGFTSLLGNPEQRDRFFEV